MYYMHWFKDSGRGVPHHLQSLLMTLRELLVLPIFTTLNSSCREVLVPKGDTLLLRYIAKPALKYKLQLLPGYFGLLIHRYQQARKGVILPGIIDSDHQKEVGILLHCKGGKE